MPAITPNNFRRLPEDILKDLLVLKAREGDADFVPCLWHYWDQWNPDNETPNPFSGESVKNRKLLEEKFGDRRFAEQLKDFHDVLLDAKMKKIDLNKLTPGEKRALQEGVEIVLPGLYAEEARYAEQSGRNAAGNIALRKTLEAGEMPPEGSVEALRLKVLEGLNKDFEKDPLLHLRKGASSSARRSSDAEQEVMFLKDAGKLTLALCGSLGIRVKESTQNFFHDDNIAR